MMLVVTVFDVDNQKNQTIPFLELRIVEGVDPDLFRVWFPSGFYFHTSDTFDMILSTLRLEDVESCL